MGIPKKKKKTDSKTEYPDQLLKKIIELLKSPNSL
jgi:hypothetical protein